ncbi:FCD domain-containing protein [Yangia mangrovi]|uniref:FCD domain-containing protein n=1 Tax=Alloyangia mangrovi TaxID=1779329 RepID=A0A2A3K058_9RHOB|nr:FCD domain-containing protein [Alloyangia mangrovi]MCT4370824.1 FCD domain-containing protein [Alloyangia mangrovi]
MLKAEQVRRKKLYENVVEQIESALVRGDLKPGDFLPAERDLCESFGVSRTAVREALFALHQSGLIDLENGRRARVIEPSAEKMIDDLAGPARFVLSRPDRLRQLQEARMMFEAFLARIAARDATDEQIAAIKSALDANEASIGDDEAFVETNITFHLAIAKVSGNVFLDSLHSAVQKWLEEHRRVAIKRAGAAERAFKRHLEIFEAIQAHDPDAAEEAMRAHLQESIDAYWAVRDENRESEEARTA